MFVVQVAVAEWYSLVVTDDRCRTINQPRRITPKTLGCGSTFWAYVFPVKSFRSICSGWLAISTERIPRQRVRRWRLLWWQGLRQECQDSEIMRILLQTAVAVRFFGKRHADE